MKVFGTLHTNTLIFTAAQMIVLGLIPFFSAKFSVTESEFIAAFSVGSFLFLFSGPFWGYVSDRGSRDLIISLGMFGLLGATFLLTADVFSNGATQVWISRIVYGLFASSIVPVTQALLIEKNKDENSLKPLLSNSISLNLGRFLGPLALALFIFLSWNIDLILSVLTSLIGIFTLLQLRRAYFSLKKVSAKASALSTPIDSTASKTSSIAKDSQNFLTSGSQPPDSRKAGFIQGILQLPRGPLWVALMFSTYIGTVNTSLAGILLAEFKLEPTAAAQWMSVVLLGAALVAVLVQVALKKYLKNPNVQLMIFASLLLLIASSLLFVLTPTSLVFLVILLGAGLCIFPPCYLALLTKGQKQLGTSTSVVSIFATLGYTLGGLLLSLSLKLQFSVPALIVATALMLMISVIFLTMAPEKSLTSLDGKLQGHSL